MDIFKELYPNSILNRQCLDYLKFFIDRILSRLEQTYFCRNIRNY